ncbi:MAG: hypothetical protein HLUCCA12_02160 [Rhodobacteraceae bacterium HLUCCA12]|nr:MAG: hypothetical protein HLUCCA12_02160 [Rhodobacteraceae bacterium HLUCCA12]
MPQENLTGRGTVGFILGVVVVVLAGVVWYLATDGNPFGRDDPGISIQLPESEEIEVPLPD